VQQLRSEGQPVFVDFTAAWCLSCQVNERVVLSSSTVKTAFAESNVAALQADWTRFDLAITEALESFGRSGVPLYVLYPADQERPPLILPTILTKKGVLEALRYLTDTAQQSSTSAVIAR
jgi:thiol:disulfide interchange protein DsbD